VASREPWDKEIGHSGFRSRSALLLLAIFLISCVAIAVLARVYFVTERRQIIDSAGAELLSIRDLKIDQIMLWRAGLLRDGRSFTNDPTMQDELDAWLADPSDPKSLASLRAWMAMMAKEGDYTGATIVSGDGTHWLTESSAAPPDAITLAEARAALRSKEATLTDLFLDPATQKARMDVIAPLLAGHDDAHAVLVLRRDPAAYLYPLLQTESSPSDSAETLLIRPQGDSIMYLNDLRFRKDSALKFSKPLGNPALLANKAVSGASGIIEGVDYRGIPVIGAVGKVDDTGWYMVVKTDQSEAFAGLAQSQRSILGAAIALVVFMGLGLALAWRVRIGEYYRVRYETERSEKLLSQQYGHLTRYANDAILLADDDLRIIQANPRAESLYGYSAGELLGLSLDELLESYDSLPSGSLLTTLSESEDHTLDVGQRRKDGSLFEAEITTQAITDEGRHLHLTIVRNITAQRQAAVALRESEDRLRRTVMLTPFPMMLHAEDGEVLLVNQAWETRSGYSSEDLPTLTAWTTKAYGSQSRDVMREIDALYHSKGQKHEGEYAIHTASGETRIWDFTTAPLGKDARGRRLVISSAVDVTESKQAQQSLRESEERFRSIVNSSPTAIYLYRLEADDRLVLSSANPASDRIIGIDHQPLIGKTIEEAFPLLVDTDIPDLYRGVARGELGSRQFEIPYQDDRFSGYYSVTVFQTGPGAVAVDFIDISERKKAEEELYQRTEELVRSNAELEKFAYIASHDLQEPLRMITSYTQLLQRRYLGQLDAEADEFIGYAVDGAKRMQSLINELLVYSRVGSMGSPFTETDLEPLLDSVLKAIEVAVADNDAVITHDPMPTVLCDPTQIGQVFQNLLTNALKFHGDAPPSIHVGAEHADGEWVFSVRDNGLGIEPAYFDRIFVIFQRLESRADYPGTGMGLAICKRVIERHGGRIWVESELGRGSTFYFTLRDE